MEKKIIHGDDLLSDHIREANKLDSAERRHQQSLELQREKNETAKIKARAKTTKKK